MVRGVCLDIAGVLVEGGAAVPGGPEAVARLADAGLPLRYLTNTTRRPKAAVLGQLTALGYPAAADEVLTPAAAACAWLDRTGHGAHLLVHPDLAGEFPASPPSAPSALIVGDAGKAFTYDALNDAFRVLEAGAPFLALAANRVFRDGDGALSLDAGAFVRALEYASGTEATVLGKPSAEFFDTAVAGLGCAPGEAAMVGDDAEADVAGALSAEFGAAYLVCTGKYAPGDETRFTPRPTETVADIGAAVDAILADA